MCGPHRISKSSASNLLPFRGIDTAREARGRSHGAPHDTLPRLRFHRNITATTGKAAAAKAAGLGFVYRSFYVRVHPVATRIAIQQPQPYRVGAARSSSRRDAARRDLPRPCTPSLTTTIVGMDAGPRAAALPRSGPARGLRSGLRLGRCTRTAGGSSSPSSSTAVFKTAPAAQRGARLPGRPAAAAPASPSAADAAAKPAGAALAAMAYRGLGGAAATPQRRDIRRAPPRCNVSERQQVRPPERPEPNGT
eukprot:365863-Chlamydomonas_euryale.AAC.6